MTKIYKKEQKTEEVYDGFKCDVCSEIGYRNENSITITTGHKSWGNDSIDSIENFDVCSLKCFIKGIKEDVFDFCEDDDSAYLKFDGEFDREQIKEITE